LDNIVIKTFVIYIVYDGLAYKSASSFAMAEKQGKQNGYRYSMFSDLPYFSLIDFAPGDPLHLVEGEVAKLYNKYVRA